MVLKVNILSPRKNQVKTGKTNKPVLEPKNLAVHAEPVLSVIALHAYQNSMLVGTPIRNADKTTRPLHHSDMFCKFN